MQKSLCNRATGLWFQKNDYYWSKINKLNNFIANGETAEVTWVGKAEKAYGRWFTEVELRLPDNPDPVAAKIMLRSLIAEGAFHTAR